MTTVRHYVVPAGDAWQAWRDLFQRAGLAPVRNPGRGDIAILPPEPGEADSLASRWSAGGAWVLRLAPESCPALGAWAGQWVLAGDQGTCAALGRRLVADLADQRARAIPAFVALYRELCEHLLDGLAPEYKARLTEQLLESGILDLLQQGKGESARKLAFRIVGTTTRHLD